MLYEVEYLYLVANQPILLNPEGEYGLSGNLNGIANPRFRYFGGAVRYGAANNNLKKNKIKIVQYTKSGKTKTIGELKFTHEKYFPTLLGKNAPEIVIYHDLIRITQSMMILLYPRRVVINGYLDKADRDRYLK